MGCVGQDALFDSARAGLTNRRGVSRLRCLGAFAEGSADDRPAQLLDRSPRRRSWIAGGRDRGARMGRRRSRTTADSGAALRLGGELTAPKNGRIRFVGMTERLAEAIRQQRHLRSRRVLCKDDGTPLTRQGAWSRVRYAAKRANVPTGVHILRHTFCSHLAMQGAPMRGVQELVGHQSLAMTQRYSAPESSGPRRNDPAARKPHDVARSWRQFGDAEGVKCLT